MFTGERVIPGEVEPDRWNEHISRYHFAAIFAAGKSALDVGCGTGYGTALLAQHASEAVGFDMTHEAISYAAAHYSGPRFLIGSPSAFPARDESVDLVTAFDLIQHLPDWRVLIEEAHRVLNDGGVFLVSTPNEPYYSETRAAAGPDAFPVHEFEAQGFEDALASVFPFVRIVAQNHQECIVFAGEQAANTGLSFTASGLDLAQAQFVVAVCAKRPVDIPAFTYVPNGGNLLREREHYIQSLESELHAARLDHATLLEAQRRLEEELNRQNAWAISLDRELDETRTDLSLTRAEKTVARADFVAARAGVERLMHERDLAASSRWVRLGRKFNVGPDLTKAPS